MSVAVPEASADAGSESNVIDLVAHAYVVTGLGDDGVIVEGHRTPSRVGLRLARYLRDTGELDSVLVLCESVETTGYWTYELARLGFATGTYYGSGASGKAKVLAARPEAVVSTFKTAVPDLARRTEGPTRSNGHWELGPLAELFTGRTLVVLASLSPVDSRASETYQGFHTWISALRAAGPHPRLLGLSQGLIPDNRLYDLGRLFARILMPTVADYEREFCDRKLIIRPTRVAELRARFGAALLTCSPEGLA